MDRHIEKAFDSLERKRQQIAAAGPVERLELENGELRRLLAIYEAGKPSFGVYLMDSLARLAGGRFDGYETYREYLQGGHWKSVRQFAIRLADGRCQLCNQAGRLEVHHRDYANLGTERPNDVIVLCDRCHSRHHEPKTRVDVDGHVVDSAMPEWELRERALIP